MRGAGSFSIAVASREAAAYSASLFCLFIYLFLVRASCTPGCPASKSQASGKAWSLFYLAGRWDSHRTGFKQPGNLSPTESRVSVPASMGGRTNSPVGISICEGK